MWSTVDEYCLEYVHSSPSNDESTNANPTSAIVQTHTWQRNAMQDSYPDDLQDLHDAVDDLQDLRDAFLVQEENVYIFTSR